MKSTITLSLDLDIIDKLKEEKNYSDLTNEQLKAYYNVKHCENLVILKQNLAKIKQIIKENKKKEKEIIQIINKIEDKNKKFLDNIDKRYPEDLIKKLKSIQNLDYDHALSLAEDYNLIKFNIGGFKIIKLWESLKGGKKT